MARSAHLPLVAPGEELKGETPAEFERLLRRAIPESPEHRGLIMIVATLTRRAVTHCVPPSTSKILLRGLESAFAWAAGNDSAAPARLQRAACFSALPVVEKATVDAVTAAQKLRPKSETVLDVHADQVVLRYASLAAHFATSAVCHSLDAIERPEAAAEVPRDIAGARAYQLAGFGSARNPEFRLRALEQAEWEAARETSKSMGHRMSELAPQIFHEYLGARWRAHSAAERLYADEFIAWAMKGAR